MSKFFYINKYTKGEYIFKENDKQDNIYFLKKGELKIDKEITITKRQIVNIEESRLKNTKKTVTIAYLDPGETFGEEQEG